jgi:hypothetical protein
MTAGERYVTTADIRSAIAGRETERLDALNIAWRDGRPDIASPYRDHPDDNPSWRRHETRDLNDWQAARRATSTS